MVVDSDKSKPEYPDRDELLRQWRERRDVDFEELAISHHFLNPLAHEQTK